MDAESTRVDSSSSRPGAGTSRATGPAEAVTNQAGLENLCAYVGFLARVAEAHTDPRASAERRELRVQGLIDSCLSAE